MGRSDISDCEDLLFDRMKSRPYYLRREIGV
jgi:hypothetical protein